MNKEVKMIVVEYLDRLAKFGYYYLKEYANSYGVETIEQKEKAEPNEEMVQDLVSIVTYFRAKIYGARGNWEEEK